MHKFTEYIKKNNLLKKIAFAGADAVPDISKKQYVVITNLFSVTIVFTSLFDCVCNFAYAQNYPVALAFFISAINFTMPVILNSYHHPLLAKLHVTIGTDIILVILYFFIPHNTTFNYYFLINFTALGLVYHSTEIKYFIIAFITSGLIMIVGSTDLEKYLPAYPLLDVPEKSSFIFLLSDFLIIIIFTFIYLYITRTTAKILSDDEELIKQNYNQLKLQNEDIKVFRMAASHSMQTPIYVLKFFIQKIFEDTNYKQEAEKELTEINENLSEMEQLVVGLFAYNQIINAEEQITKTDILYELHQMKERFTRKYPGTKINLPDKKWVIDANKNLLTGVIENLIDNGLKYNVSESPEVNINIEKDPKFILIRISDNGVGIEEKYFDKIFKPFNRLQSDKHKGNGLGLTASKRAAEKMGGKLYLNHSSTSGTEFILQLPLNSSIEIFN